MPRRDLKTREATNAQFLGDDYKFTRDPELAAKRAESRRHRSRSTSRLKMRTCEIRGCRTDVPDIGPLAVCMEHAVVIWEIVEQHDQDAYLRETLGTYIAERDRIRAETREAERVEEAKAMRSPDAHGDVYFVRVSGLIKVGWTSNLTSRMRAYGPEAELLANFPGTRRDESNLHRQLKPARAKGREWYNDGPIINRFIDDTLSLYGPPDFKRIAWTEHQDRITPKSWH